MASKKNDALRERTVEGSVNFYDGQKCFGTATDKGLASRLGGHSYNILSNESKDEIYLRNLRSDSHFVDKKGRHTQHLFGDRRRKFATDERNLVKGCLTGPADHPRIRAMSQQRVETQLAQMENLQSYGAFQERCHAHLLGPFAVKRYSINDLKYGNEVGKLGARFTDKASFKERRGETMTRSISAPSLDVTRPAESLAQAAREDSRKAVSCRQNESANFANVRSANSYAASVESTALGREHCARQDRCSINRLENGDFSVARKNNHFSSQDKLTRSDPYYMRPKFAGTNSSVKYDIVTNNRKWFKYGD